MCIFKNIYIIIIVNIDTTFPTVKKVKFIFFKSVISEVQCLKFNIFTMFEVPNNFLTKMLLFLSEGGLISKFNEKT